MLEFLKVQNYQILKNLELKLDKFVVIVGSSGSGKSAIVRALRSLFTASTGLGVVKHGETAYKIGLALDGKQVGWVKGKKTNTYVTGAAPEDRYDKVGLDVPDKAARLFNLGIVHFGDKRTIVNIQDQHDSPFLISETGSVVSEFLGSVSGLDKLFVIVDEIASDIRKTKIKLSDRDEQLKQVEQQIDMLAPMAEIKQQVDEIVKRMQELSDEREALAVAEEKLRQRSELINRIAVIEACEKECFPELTKCEARFENLKGVAGEQAGLVLKLQDLKIASDNLAFVSNQESQARGTLEKLLVGVESEVPTEGDCPTCGQVITAECVSKIVKGLREKYAVS